MVALNLERKVWAP